MTKRFYSHGKLLITGEYAVLDGALSLALPTKKGQSLDVKPLEHSSLKWQSFLKDHSLWLDYTFDLPLTQSQVAQEPLHLRVQQLLQEVKKLKPALLDTGLHFTSTLEFDRSWGLGSSSTLISNLAQWANIDPYILLKNTFGGSGYDIACAQAKGPITFQLVDGKPEIERIAFTPNFKEEVFFVHLNRKQNSRESIQHYRNTASQNLQSAIAEISQITKAIIGCQNITDFEALVDTHERLISKLIKTPTIKTQLFSDYPRSIKSLGGWGGDFILATGSEKEKTYFKEKGFRTLFSYSEMVL